MCVNIGVRKGSHVGLTHHSEDRFISDDVWGSDEYQTLLVLRVAVIVRVWLAQEVIDGSHHLDHVSTAVCELVGDAHDVMVGDVEGNL